MGCIPSKDFTQHKVRPPKKKFKGFGGGGLFGDECGEGGWGEGGDCGGDGGGWGGGDFGGGDFGGDCGGCE